MEVIVLLENDEIYMIDDNIILKSGKSLNVILNGRKCRHCNSREHIRKYCFARNMEQRKEAETEKEKEVKEIETDRRKKCRGRRYRRGNEK